MVLAGATLCNYHHDLLSQGPPPWRHCKGVNRMPDRITDPQPPEVAAQLASLSAALD
jgi:hypothetical protein